MGEDVLLHRHHREGAGTHVEEEDTVSLLFQASLILRDPWKVKASETW